MAGGTMRKGGTKCAQLTPTPLMLMLGYRADLPAQRPAICTCESRILIIIGASLLSSCAWPCPHAWSAVNAVCEAKRKTYSSASESDPSLRSDERRAEQHCQYGKNPVLNDIGARLANQITLHTSRSAG